MSTRRILVVAAIVVVLSTLIVFYALAERSRPEDKAPMLEPTGQASESAERAQADLASRLNTTADKIVVEAVQPHTWSDASLGLPESGMMYAQVLTPGYIVILRYDGQTYVYHVAGQTVKLNPNPSS